MSLLAIGFRRSLETVLLSEDDSGEKICRMVISLELDVRTRWKAIFGNGLQSPPSGGKWLRCRLAQRIQKQVSPV